MQPEKKNVRVRFVLSADGLNVRWKKSVVVISELNGKKGGLKKSDASKCDLMKGRFYGVIWKRNPWDRDYEVPAGICFVIRNKGNIVFCAWIT